ncbi:MAG: DUF4397 domain-containing protein [bacterium]|nr:DUF4397 domain-containing protein [Candidatus Kapabacteria bacterium]
MSIDLRSLRAFGAAILLGVTIIGATGCGDDPAPAPPPARYAPITVFNAVTDIGNSAISFKIGSTLLTANALFGTPVVAGNALVGTGTEVEAFAGGGSSLGKSTVGIDTNKSVWIIAAGAAIGAGNSAVFGVSNDEPTPPPGKVLVRVIHASNNAPELDARLDDAFGTQLATGLVFKESGAFVSIPLATTKISFTNTGVNTELLLFSIDTPLVADKVYNLVIFGSTDVNAAADRKLQAKMLLEPA